METKMPIFPFEVTYEEIVKNPESYVDAVFSCLESEFLVMPKGTGFVEYPVFERGYEALKASTQGFSRVESSNVLAGVLKEPISLYERFLGRPFAGHRDSVSELVGDNLESAIEEVLARAGISFRKTKRAERIEGFDQIPDFIVPSEFNPQVIIEAKITEDDGTARDKVTRIQHLVSLSRQSQQNTSKYEVVACIGGRGFGVRREDMKKLILWTKGKVFTVKTLDRLVEYTRLREFRTK